MGWLPSVLVLVVGIVLLALLVVLVVRGLRRTQVAAQALAVAVAGRRMRVLAGVGELNAWRAARRSAIDSDGDA